MVFVYLVLYIFHAYFFFLLKEYNFLKTFSELLGFPNHIMTFYLNPSFKIIFTGEIISKLLKSQYLCMHY